MGQAPQRPAGRRIPDVTGASWEPLTFRLTETKILSNLTSWVPQQMKRSGPLLLFGRETQRQPHLISKVWAEGCHQYLSSASCQDPPSDSHSTPPCEAGGFPTRECWQAVPAWGLKPVSNAINMKLNYIISRGQSVCGSWLKVWLGGSACKLCEGRAKPSRVFE